MGLHQEKEIVPCSPWLPGRRKLGDAESGTFGLGINPGLPCCCFLGFQVDLGPGSPQCSGEAADCFISEHSEFLLAWAGPTASVALQ